jgi:hypothetical protein
MRDIKPGRYWLVTRHRAAVGIEVRLKIGAASKSSEVRGAQIVFVLAADLSKSCGGGDVRLVEH